MRFCYLGGLLLGLAILSINLEVTESCYFAKIIFNNETVFNTTGWSKNVLHPKGVKPFEPNPSDPTKDVFVPNPEQDCICGGGSIPGNKAPGGPDERNFLAKLVIYMNGAVEFVCTGVLINSKFVLTAAHCLCSAFLDCSKTDARISSDDVTFFSPLNSSHGLEVFLGFKKGDPKSILDTTAVKPIRIIIHDKYIQNNDEIAAYDVALVELSNQMAVDSGVQPICLPPKEEGSDGDENHFEDLDCFVSKAGTPFPFVVLSDEVLTCPPDSRHSLIDGFKDFHQESDEKNKCTTNGFGPVKNGICEEECKKDDSYFNQSVCNPIWESAIKAGAEKIAHILTEGSNVCYPKIDFGNPEGHLHFQHYDQGWCNACPRGSSKIDCPTPDQKFCCGNSVTPVAPDQTWGFCDTTCHKMEPPEETDPMTAVFHEIAAQTFPKTGANKNLCEVTEDEFCTGAHTGPYIEATFENKNGAIEFTGYKNKFHRDKPPSKSSTKCYGFAGGPVWANRTFTASEGASHKRLVLTGITSRHEGRCAVDQDSNDGVEATVHSRVQKMLPWILEKSAEGKCKHVQTIISRMKNKKGEKGKMKKH